MVALAAGAFVYHFPPVVPLGCVALAVVLSGLWRRGGWKQGAAVGYAVAAAVVFAFFYPILAALPITQHEFELRLRLEGWR